MSEVDLPYNFTSSVTYSDGKLRDIDNNNIPLLQKHLKDIDALIAVHNSFDVIDPNSKLTAEQQVMAHKQLVQYLRAFRADVNNKLGDLSDG